MDITADSTAPSSAQSTVDAIRADFRRITGSPVLLRMWHGVATRRERAADRAAARGVCRLGHPGVIADYHAALRFR